MTARLAAPLFVLLWSTGFVGARWGLPDAPAMGFLALRFMTAAALLGAIAVAVGAAWPGREGWHRQAVVGGLLHGGYLGGVFAAIDLGVEAGVAALIVSLQPIVTAALAGPLLGERMTRTQWLGLALGLAGSALVLARKLDGGVGDLTGAALCAVALVAISVATLYRKRFEAGGSVAADTTVQYLAALALVAPFALMETEPVRWTPDFVFALGWLVLVLSLGAVGLLMWLLARGAASEVASLFFLVPPVTALMAWALFGEVMGPLALAGMGIAVLGVALTMRGGAG